MYQSVYFVRLQRRSKQQGTNEAREENVDRMDGK